MIVTMIMIMKVNALSIGIMTNKPPTASSVSGDMPMIALKAVSSLSRSSLTSINVAIEHMTGSYPIADVIRDVDEVQLLERQNIALQESLHLSHLDFQTRIEFARERLDHEESMIAWTLQQADLLVANHNPQLSDRRTSTFAIDQALRRAAEKLNKLETKLAFARQTLPLADKLRIVSKSNQNLRDAMSAEQLDSALRLFRLNELLHSRIDDMARARQEHECAIALTMMPVQIASST
ncbi:hypothetical protein CALCODRAFT_482056 [Calocera cornea HHB12733]|uniref:Uncharacterized protein n=1 Tax=Calocera cornea HHB12733 TaxID=1353952 RepID=A0A165H204_9BASI|nr:hypothetical protein CALCODRAFT_482056 [Calocera cornea HHB12733]